MFLCILHLVGHWWIAGLHLKPILPHGVSFSLRFDCWWLAHTEAVIPNTTFTCLLSDLLHICRAAIYRVLVSQQKTLLCDPEILS